MATSSSSCSVDVFKTKIEKITVTALSRVKSKQSFCWNYFGHLDVIVDGKKRTVLGDQVFCEACLRKAKEKDCNVLFSEANVKAYSKNIATSNLLRHLKDEHKLEDNKQKSKACNIPIESFFGVQRRPAKQREDSDQKNKWQLSRDLALWFARSLIPFDSIDDEAMKDFLKKYNVIVSDSDLPSRHNIAREGLEDVYESMLAYVKSIIQRHTSRYGALTTDLWTDQYRRRNYITCTFHFINEDMELKKFTLATKQITEKHTGETIKDYIQEILQDFLIDDKSVVLVTDAGSNMKRAATLLNLENHLCLGHALHNLVTVDGIQSTEELFNLITKCKKLVKHLRYRAPQLEAAASKEHRDILLGLDEIGEVENTNEAVPSDEDSDSPESQHSTAIPAHPPTIKTSTPTRWHSMLMMLTSLNHRANRRPINDMLNDIGRHSYQLKDHEHKLIADLTTFLEKIKQYVEILCSETETTINLAMVFKSELKRLLEECNDNEPIIITRLKNNMLAKLEHRFPTNEITVAASLLDCRFHSIKEIDQYMENQGTTKVSFLTRMVQKYVRDSDISISKEPSAGSTSAAEPQPGPSSATSSILANLAQRHSVQQGQQDRASVVECWKYFSSATSVDLEPYNGNILLYWKDRKTSFPCLSALARALLFIPATSTSSERVFSVAGQVITAKRSRLNPLRINRIIFIHDNYHHCKQESL